MELSKKMLNFYKEEGYLVVDNVLPISLLQEVEKVITAVIKEVLQRASRDCNAPELQKIDNIIDQGIVELRKHGLQYPSIVQRIVNRTPAFLNLSTHPDIATIVRELNQYSKNNPLYLLSNSLIFSDPNKQGDKSPSQFIIDWHNDVFSTVPYSHFTHMWAPLVHDLTTERGTLMICPKSHNILVKQEVSLDVPYNHRFTVNKSDLEKFSPISVEVKLGQVLFFDGGLIHRSGYNASNLMRYSMIGLFHDVFNENFLPVATHYKYMKRTPYEHYYQLFGGEHLKPVMYDELELDEDLKKTSV